MDITKNEKQLEFFSVSSQRPENKKILDEAPWWHIDKEMLRFKLHFFLFIGGLGTACPYIPVLARDSIGLSESSVAYILTVEQFLRIFSKPLLGFLTDYFKKLKATITILTVVSAILLFSLLTISRISNFKSEGSTVESEFGTFKATNVSSGNIVCNQININKTSECEYHTNLFCSFESLKQKEIFVECYKVTVTKPNRTVVETKASTYNGYNLTDLGNEHDLDILCSLCCNLTEDCYFISCFKSLKYNEDTKQGFSQFKTYQFWWFGVTLTFAYALASSLFTLSDTACCETVAKTRAKFGQQRLYGAVGMGAMAPIGGLLYDYTDDYLLSWIIMGLMLALSLWNLWKMDLVHPQFSQNILKDVGKVLRNAEFLAFALGVLLNGMGCGIILFYQVWFLTNLGGSRLLCGLVYTVQCFLGEIPFMFYSDWFIKKLGHSNILSFSLATYCIRFFFYSYLQDPWLTLPMEVVHGITHGLVCATVASYAKLSAKPGTEATTQSILFSTHEGLGWGLGCVLAGLVLHSIGGHQTFFYASILSGCGMFVNLFLTLLNSRRKKSVNVTTSK
ncbi:hypothetical protein JTE90_006246 [Oedothorax gibbosus]|uniref:Major facilitator superfamily associated domain-containing protein n=1 Tax=Oedothorax gibbosus TaxID=931172 RepID=A0AAV6UA22_9ARAC|nr:hypothetical protein JTE90_006246 [Oedothorax gibbosus]